MASIFQRPVVIAAIVAALSIITIIVVDHTDFVVEQRPRTTPPGTTFNTVNDAGGQLAPTQPASPLEPPRVGPATVPAPKR
jgi:hypothetical protein